MLAMILSLAAPIYLWSFATLASDVVEHGQPKSVQLKEDFAKRLKTVSANLIKYHSDYLTRPEKFDEFINAHLASVWDIESLSRALLGKQLFDPLAKTDREDLVAEVDRTLRRYAFEGLPHYSGQTFDVFDAVVNGSATRGWVQVAMRSSILPTIYFDILVKRKKGQTWRAVDVRFKGITYVSMKKHGFREIVKKKSITALQRSLANKNDAFFSELCSSINETNNSIC